MKALVAALVIALVLVQQYHLPAEGDIRHWDNEPWQYRCNWVGCDWFTFKGEIR